MTLILGSGCLQAASVSVLLQPRSQDTDLDEVHRACHQVVPCEHMLIYDP